MYKTKFKMAWRRKREREKKNTNIPRWNIHPRSSWLNIHEINFSIPGNNTVHGRAAEVNLANPWCRMKIRPFWSKHIYFFKRSTSDITWVQWNYWSLVDLHWQPSLNPLISSVSGITPLLQSIPNRVRRGGGS